MQTTLKADVHLAGIGLHSGRPARLVLRRAKVGDGIVFRRVDVTDRDPLVPARFDHVGDTTLNTRLVNGEGVAVSTVEHLMAAIAGCGLHNVMIDIDGPEVPIMDGSAARFVRAILAAGLARSAAPVDAWRVMRSVAVEIGDARAEIAPAEGLSVAFEIDFPDAAIGRQALSLDLGNGAFVRQLADCRTFCRRAEVELMQSRGLALGGTLDNAVVVDGAEVLNPGGFRRADECVRHKMLDVVGDLALAGLPVLGAYRGVRAGHGVTNALLRKLFAEPGAVERVTCHPGLLRRLPGNDLRAADLAATA